jgi:hypothetical protein
MLRNFLGGEAIFAMIDDGVLMAITALLRLPTDDVDK